MILQYCSYNVPQYIQMFSYFLHYISICFQTSSNTHQIPHRSHTTLRMWKGVGPALPPPNAPHHQQDCAALILIVSLQCTPVCPSVPLRTCLTPSGEMTLVPS